MPLPFDYRKPTPLILKLLIILTVIAGLINLLLNFMNE